MKPARLLLLAIASFATLFSCKKESQDDAVAVQCNIVSYVETSPYESIKLLLSYYPDGRIAKVYGQGGSRDFVYSGDTIITTESDTSGRSYELVRTVLDESKNVISYVFKNHDGSIYQSAICKRKPNGDIDSMYSISHGDTIISTAEYEQGNLKRFVGENVAPGNFNYYSDKPAIAGDFYQFMQWIYHGVPIWRNKNLVRSTTSYKFTYDFDGDGKVIRLKWIDGSFVTTYAFAYDCK